MEKTKRQKYSVRAVYLILMLVCAAILTVTIAMLVNKKAPDPIDPEVSGNAVPSTEERPRTPETTKRPPSVFAPETDASVDNPNPDKPDKPDKPASASVTWAMPAAGIVTKSHDLTKQVFSVTMNDYRVHCGIDIQTSAGANVTAAADGTVLSVEKDPFMGTTIAIQHDNQYVSYYKNLQETVAEGIAAGSKVKAGQIIGAVGETAIIEISEEPHLHFEIKHAGEYADPLSLLPYDPASASAPYED